MRRAGAKGGAGTPAHGEEAVQEGKRGEHRQRGSCTTAARTRRGVSFIRSLTFARCRCAVGCVPWCLFVAFQRAGAAKRSPRVAYAGVARKTVCTAASTGERRDTESMQGPSFAHAHSVSRRRGLHRCGKTVSQREGADALQQSCRARSRGTRQARLYGYHASRVPPAEPVCAVGKLKEKGGGGEVGKKKPKRKRDGEMKGCESEGAACMAAGVLLVAVGSSNAAPPSLVPFEAVRKPVFKTK